MKMKKNIIILLLGYIFFAAGCDKSSYDLPDPDGRLNDLVVEFKHKSPKTGEFITNQFTDLYRAEDVVEIQISTNYSIDRIEIANGQTLVALTTINVNGTNASYTIPVSELGVPFGQRVSLLFHMFFDDAGKDGFDFPSIKSYAFNVVDDIPPVVNFKQSNGTLTEIYPTDHNIVGYAMDEQRGVVVEFVPDESSYLDIGENSLFNFGTNNFSISFWINSDHDVSDPAIMGTMDWNSSNNSGWVLAWLNGKVRVVAGDGAGTKTDFRSDESLLGQGWKFVTVTFNRTGEAVLYFDAVQKGAAPMEPVDINNGVSVKINQDGTTTYGDKLGAKYSDIVFYNYALTPAQVTEAFNSSKAYRDL